jgi:CRP-like cAMP-binding protein
MLNQSTNSLLASLSPQYSAHLLTRLKPVSFGPKEVLYEPDEVPKFAHFMTSGVASIVASMANGGTAEVGIWGKEGLVESFHLLGGGRMPTRCFIQVSGTALRMPYRDLLKEFQESDELREAVLQCVQSQAFILCQLAACNRLHEAEERLARWFLMVRDRMESDTFYLTQDFLATMLGSRRTTVTAAAGELQRKGFIRYSRGRIFVVDPGALETEACECYATVRSIHRNFYAGVAAM